jgi:hypothetical protein
MKKQFFSCSILILATVFWLTPLCPALADTSQTFWTGERGVDWDDPLNWDPIVPSLSHDSMIDKGPGAIIGDTIFSQYPLFPGGFNEANNLILGSGPGLRGNLSINQILPPVGPLDLFVSSNFLVGGTWDTSSAVSHDSGNVEVGDTLQLGRDSGAEPGNNQPQFYAFNGGSLRAQNVMVGGGGFGSFRQWQGTSFVVNADLKLGQNRTAQGILNKRGGDLEINGSLYVGNSGNGQYYHGGGIDPGDIRLYGGTTTVHSNLIIGNNDNGDGTFGTGYLCKMGQTGSGDFLHVDGDLIVGRDGSGRYDHGGYDGDGFFYDGGETTVDGTLILGAGGNSVGILNQFGGSITVTGTLTIGANKSEGWTRESYRYEIWKGTLNVHNLNVNAGIFHIRDAAAIIKIIGDFSVGSDGRFFAVAGSTVALTGGNFINHSTAPTNLWGLGNLSLKFAGGGPAWQTLEIGGRNYGQDSQGFTDNFHLADLTVTGNNTRVSLQDDSDNGNRGFGNAPEALYVNTLHVNPGATLNLNKLPLYTYHDSQIHRVRAGDGALFGGGRIIDSGRVAGAILLLLLR